MGNESSATKPQPGLFLNCLVMSNKADLRRKKDGSGHWIIVTCEIATQPGLVEYTRFLDPSSSKEVKVVGDAITEFPKLPELKPITLKILNWRTDDRRKRFIVTEAETIQGSRQQ